jgi:hypothetical protein
MSSPTMSGLEYTTAGETLDEAAGVATYEKTSSNPSMKKPVATEIQAPFTVACIVMTASDTKHTVQHSAIQT